jgi:hypothetical protein
MDHDAAALGRELDGERGFAGGRNAAEKEHRLGHG